MNITNISAAYFEANAFEPAVKKEKQLKGLNNTARTEQVELSQTSLEMQKVRDEIKTKPEVRIPIVEEIRERIKNNDYPIENHFNDALEVMTKNKILLPY